MFAPGNWRNGWAWHAAHLEGFLELVDQYHRARSFPSSHVAFLTSRTFATPNTSPFRCASSGAWTPIKPPILHINVRIKIIPPLSLHRHRIWNRATSWRCSLDACVIRVVGSWLYFCITSWRPHFCPGAFPHGPKYQVHGILGSHSERKVHAVELHMQTQAEMLNPCS